MSESTTPRARATLPARCPRCGGTLIAGAAQSEAVCLNCGYVAYASGLTTQAADAELTKRPSLPIATAGERRHDTDSE